jgi:hypothetical protein
MAKEIDFSYTGLFIAVLILLGMLVICHLKNYFNSKSRNIQNSFINLAIPSGTLPLEYNKISYSGGSDFIPCEVAAQANVPCSQIQTPCQSTPTTTKPQMQLSESELAIIYKEAYEQAGLELINRTLRGRLPNM